MPASSSAAKAAKLVAKVGPGAIIAWQTVGPVVKDAVEAQQRTWSNRRLAFAKARTVVDGTVLEQLDGDRAVFVVFSGDDPVEAYPKGDKTPTELVRNADMTKRVTPEEHDAAKMTAKAKKLVKKPKSSDSKELGSGS